MTDVTDLWYVRLPDGRVVRAKTTKSLRYHVSSGRIPPDARVRRTPAEEWMALEWTAEFADIVAKEPGVPLAPNVPLPPLEHGGRSRSRSPEMKVLGVRGLIDELLNALDSTLTRYKLMPALALALLLGVGTAFCEALAVNLEPPWSWLGLFVTGVCVLLGFCAVSSVISQMTFLELSRLRLARTKELRAGLKRHAVQLMLAHLLVGGVLLLVFLLLQKLDQPHLADVARAPLSVIRLICEVVFWPLWGLMLLFAPIVVIEECAFPRAILEWWGMLRRHVGRLLLYETMATLFGLVVAAPFLVPVLLAVSSLEVDAGLVGMARLATAAILGGLAATPLVAYLLVANVHIYLNLRYEFSQAGR
jgi:hypothetical protein